MAKLLVSVRNVAEAEAALAGGADLVDVKEPGRGPLGAPDAATVAAIVDHVAGRAPTSAALGELLEGHRLDTGSRPPDYAKFGLAGCARHSDWIERLRDAIGQLPAGVSPVAVAYADSYAAGAPDPWDVLAAARALCCAAVLIDTFDKNGGSLTNHWTARELELFLRAARENELLTVVAGGLDRDAVRAVAVLGPDYIGVRGGVCRGGRTGRLDAGRVQQFGTLARAIAQPTR